MSAAVNLNWSNIYIPARHVIIVVQCTSKALYSLADLFHLTQSGLDWKELSHFTITPHILFLHKYKVLSTTAYCQVFTHRAEWTAAILNKLAHGCKMILTLNLPRISPLIVWYFNPSTIKVYIMYQFLDCRWQSELKRSNVCILIDISFYQYSVGPCWTKLYLWKPTSGCLLKWIMCPSHTLRADLRHVEYQKLKLFHSDGQSYHRVHQQMLPVVTSHCTGISAVQNNCDHECYFSTLQQCFGIWYTHMYRVITRLTRRKHIWLNH